MRSGVLNYPLFFIQQIKLLKTLGGYYFFFGEFFLPLTQLGKELLYLAEIVYFSIMCSFKRSKREVKAGLINFKYSLENRNIDSFLFVPSER